MKKMKYEIHRGFTETRTGREIPLYHVVDPRDGYILDSFSRRYFATYYCNLWNSRDFPDNNLRSNVTVDFGPDAFTMDV